MGSIAVTTGSVRVKTCSEVGTILKDLGRLAEGMDERQVSGHRRGEGVMEVEIYIPVQRGAGRSRPLPCGGHPLRARSDEAGESGRVV